MTIRRMFLYTVYSKGYLNFFGKALGGNGCFIYVYGVDIGIIYAIISV